MSLATGTPTNSDGGTPAAGADTGQPQADNQQGQWWGGLEPDLQSHPSLEKFKNGTPGDVFKSYINLEKTLGADKVALPGKDAPPEAWDEVFKKLGRPDSVEGYTFDPMPPDLGDIPDAKDTEAGFKEAALKAGLNPAQAKMLRDWYLQRAGTVMTEHALTPEKGEAALKKEWGAQYEAELGVARKVIRRFGDAETMALLDQGYGNHPTFVKLMNRIGRAMGEDVFKGREDGTGGTDMQLEAARTEITKIMGDKDGPYWVQTHPQHKEVVARVANLYEMAYPPKPPQQ